MGKMDRSRFEGKMHSLLSEIAKRWGAMLRDVRDNQGKETDRIRLVRPMSREYSVTTHEDRLLTAIYTDALKGEKYSIKIEMIKQ